MSTWMNRKKEKYKRQLREGIVHTIAVFRRALYIEGAATQGVYVGYNKH